MEAEFPPGALVLVIPAVKYLESMKFTALINLHALTNKNEKNAVAAAMKR